MLLKFFIFSISFIVILTIIILGEKEKFQGSEEEVRETQFIILRQHPTGR